MIAAERMPDLGERPCDCQCCVVVDVVSLGELTEMANDVQRLRAGIEALADSGTCPAWIRSKLRALLAEERAL